MKDTKKIPKREKLQKKKQNIHLTELLLKNLITKLHLAV